MVTGATAACTGALAAGGLMVVYDGVVSPWSLPSFAAAAGLRELHYAVLLPPLEACLERATRRNRARRTEMPPHMHAEFSNAELPVRHVVDSSGDDPKETVSTVLRLRAQGALVHRR